MADSLLLGVPRIGFRPFMVEGAPGVASYSGFLVEQEKDASLQGLNKYLTFSDVLANVAIVSAGVHLFLNLVAKAEWTAQPADASPEALEKARFVESVFGDLKKPWSRVVKRAAMAKFYGFAILEWTAKLRDDGLVGFLSVDSRSQSTIERWDLSPTGDVLGIVQRSPQDQREIYVPRQKLVHVVDDSIHDSPEGLGLLRHVVKATKRLERYELLEAWGYETDLRGIPIGRGPLMALEQLVAKHELSEAQATALLKPLSDFIKKHNKSPALGMMIDSSPYRAGGEVQAPSSVPQWNVELLRGEGGPHAEVAAAIERTNREIARVLGVEHLLLGGSDRGSFAMASSKSQAFGMIVDSALTELRQAFDKDLLDPLWALNGWDPALKPKLVTSQAQYRDVEEITGALKDIAQAGAPLVPGDPVVNQVRAFVGLVPTPADQDLALPPEDESGEFPPDELPPDEEGA